MENFGIKEGIGVTLRYWISLITRRFGYDCRALLPCVACGGPLRDIGPQAYQCKDCGLIDDEAAGIFR
jgi:hypothetical protein